MRIQDTHQVLRLILYFCPSSVILDSGRTSGMNPSSILRGKHTEVLVLSDDM